MAGFLLCDLMKNGETWQLPLRRVRADEHEGTGTMPILAVGTLAGNYDITAAVLAGLLGGVAFLLVVYMGLTVGMTQMNFLYILGTMMAPQAQERTVYTIGLAAHMMASVGFGLAHAGLLHAVGVSSVAEAVGWDFLIGALHGMAILALMPMMLTTMHVLVRRGQIPHPGVALVGFGSMTPMGSLMAHVMFGLVVGAVYAGLVL